MSRPMWFVEMIKKTFPGVTRTAKLTRVPLIGRMLEHKFFEGDRIVILPQDNVIELGEEIEGSGGVVLPSRVVERFIEKANPEHIWIMDRCICRDSMGCERYPVDIGCLFMGEAVHDINPGLGRLASKEEALDHVRRAREAGLFHLIGRNRIDTWWLNVGPPRKLLTVCSCCTCCCLWRIVPEVSGSIRERVRMMPGVTVTVTDACTGCGECAEGVCLVDCIEVKSGRAVIGDLCVGCGHCVEACPRNAIELTIEDEDFVDKSVQRIAPVIDVS